MIALRAYRFELCWLLLLIAIFLLSPSRSSANSFHWIDLAFDCDSVSGWCITIPVDLPVIEH
jgi:hypothetical protein